MWFLLLAVLVVATAIVWNRAREVNDAVRTRTRRRATPYSDGFVAYAHASGGDAGCGDGGGGCCDGGGGGACG